MQVDTDYDPHNSNYQLHYQNNINYLDFQNGDIDLPHNYDQFQNNLNSQRGEQEFQNNFNNHNPNIESLEQILKNQKPRDFAQDFCYNLNQQREKKHKNNQLLQSQQYQKPLNQQSQSKLNIFQSPKSLLKNYSLKNEFPVSNFQDQQQHPTVYTKLSESKLFQTMSNKKNDQGRLKFSTEEKQNINSNNIFATEDLQRIQDKMEVQGRSLEQQQLMNRLANEKENWEVKKKLQTKQLQDQQFQECTFTPKINNFYNNTHVDRINNNHDEVYEHLMNKAQQYEQNKQLREKEMLEQEKQIYQHQPHISKKTDELAQKKMKKLALSPDVHERLNQVKVNHQLSKKQKNQNGTNKVTNGNLIMDNNSNMSEEDDNMFLDDNRQVGNQRQYIDPKKQELLACTFSPQISKRAKNVQRNQNTTDFLYDDAKKRSEKRDQIFEQEYEQKQFQSQQPNFVSITSPRSQNQGIYMSGKSMASFASKFIKEFNFTLKEVIPNQKKTKMHYLELIEFMKKLGFLKEEKYHIQTEKISNNQSSQNNSNLMSNESLVRSIWMCLRDSKSKNYICSRNLLVFLLAVQNVVVESDLVPLLRKKDREEDPSNRLLSLEEDHSIQDEFKNEQKGMDFFNQESQLNRLQKFGYFDNDGNLRLYEKEVQYVSKNFKILYHNRLSRAKDKVEEISYSIEDSKIFNDQFKNSHRKNVHQFYNYKPMLSPESHKLASNKKNKLLSEMKEAYEHSNLENKDVDPKKMFDLNEQKKFQQFQTQTKLLDLKQQIKQEELAECTFKPQISQYSKYERLVQNQIKRQMKPEIVSVDLSDNILPKKHAPTSPYGTGEDRNLVLYELSKIQSQRRDRDKAEIEYEKQCDECTFNPDIKQHNQSRRDYLSPKNIQNRGIDKHLERIKNARINQQITQNLQKKGHTYNKNLDKQATEDALNKKEEKLKVKRKQDIPHDYSKNIYGSQLYSNNDKIDDTLDINEPYQYQPQPELQKDANQEDAPKLQKADSTGRIPILYVDVNISEGMNERIVIYDGDKSEEIVENFAQTHGLNEDMKRKLRVLLDMQIRKVLTNIEEANEEEILSEGH